MALNATARPVDPRIEATCVADVLAALGSPSRVVMVRELAAAGPLDVGDLAVRLGVSVANASHHRVRLRAERIVASHRVGTRVINELASPAIAELLDRAEALCL
jgi:DNA-binding transcriptional ArsR family regulator